MALEEDVGSVVEVSVVVSGVEVSEVASTAGVNAHSIKTSTLTIRDLINNFTAQQPQLVSEWMSVMEVPVVPGLMVVVVVALVVASKLSRASRSWFAT